MPGGIAKRVWGEKSDGVRPMRTMVSRLRRKLGEDAGTNQLVKGLKRRAGTGPSTLSRWKRGFEPPGGTSSARRRTSGLPGLAAGGEATVPR